MSSSQSQQQVRFRRPARILTFDAGGVNALASLIILDRIMDTFNEDRPPASRLHPWQMFDMIAGVETGGLIAIMLGRLRMSIGECEVAFKRLCTNIYQNTDDSEVLKREVQGMIRWKVGHSGRIDMVETTPECPCKVLVGLTTPGQLGHHVITSYPRINVPISQYMNQRGHEVFELWEVCAATIATNGYFEPVLIKDATHEQLYCPSNEFDEPNHFIKTAFAQLWPGGRGLVVSIGNGDRPKQYPGQVPANYEYNLDNWFSFYRNTYGNMVPIEQFTHFAQIKHRARTHLNDQQVKDRIQRYMAELRATFIL